MGEGPGVAMVRQGKGFARRHESDRCGSGVPRYARDVLLDRPPMPDGRAQGRDRLSARSYRSMNVDGLPFVAVRSRRLWRSSRRFSQPYR